MALIENKYDKKDPSVFYTDSSDHPFLRLHDTNLSRSDWEIIRAALESAFYRGTVAGSEARAKEIREALGI